MKNLLITLLLTMIITGCEDIEPAIEVPSLNIEELVLNEQLFLEIVNNIQNFQDPNKPRVESLNGTDEDEIAMILDPLVSNGETIHNEYKEIIYNSSDFKSLPASDQEQITQEIDLLTDQQLAELAFAVNLEYYVNQNNLNINSSSIDWERVLDCASFAAGIRGIQELIANSVTASSVTTMIGALKHIGKRYLGWFGVAMMIYDFSNCLYGSD